MIVIGAVILALVPYARLIWGVDFTDSGYSIVNFEHFLDRRAFWSLATYASNGLGWLFMHFPGGSTFIGIRAYCTFVVSALNMLIYFQLIKEYQPFSVFLGLLMSVFLTWCPYVVLYNYLSYYMIAATLLSLIKGLKHGNRRMLVAAGVLVGVSVFVRFSNIIMVALILAVIYYDYLSRKRFLSGLKDIGMCVIGFLIGAGVMYALTCITHGPDAYFKMIDTLVSLGKADYGYSISDMLLTLPAAIYDHIKWIGAALVAVAIAIALSHFDSSRKEMYVLTTFLSVFLMIWELYVIRRMAYWGEFTIHDYNDNNAVFIFVVFLVILAVIFAWIDIWSQRSNYLHKFISFALLILVVIIPLGTNTGILAYQNAMFLMLPVTFSTAWDKMFARTRLRMPGMFLKGDQNYAGRIGIYVILIAATLWQSILYFGNYCYASAKTTELTATYTHGKLKGTRMLPGMVDIIGDLETFFEEENLHDRKVITWGDIPLTSFILDVDTAFSTGWPDLKGFSSDVFEDELSQMDNPIIIVSKWYSGGDPLNPEVWVYSDKAEMLADYMVENDYSIRFENDRFRVYMR